ncbi:uncharacterized protein [Symphalangus syndactylus]|uniref:uncharacterized protein isoform X2 n=1 Tax=Symphalangus syndactylus TaxID=9590 RepID=UPI002441D514|nr:uncharacterized protein LOC129475035 isoform X1 [Symphalangus syndactylus]
MPPRRPPRLRNQKPVSPSAPARPGAPDLSASPGGARAGPGGRGRGDPGLGARALPQPRGAVAGAACQPPSGLRHAGHRGLLLLRIWRRGEKNALPGRKREQRNSTGRDTGLSRVGGAGRSEPWGCILRAPLSREQPSEPPFCSLKYQAFSFSEDWQLHVFVPAPSISAQPHWAAWPTPNPCPGPTPTSHAPSAHLQPTGALEALSASFRMGSPPPRLLHFNLYTSCWSFHFLTPAWLLTSPASAPQGMSRLSQWPRTSSTSQEPQALPHPQHPSILPVGSGHVSSGHIDILTTWEVPWSSDTVRR